MLHYKKLETVTAQKQIFVHEILINIYLSDYLFDYLPQRYTRAVSKTVRCMCLVVYRKNLTALAFS